MAEHGEVDAAGWFVEQDQTRSGHERHGGIEQLLLSVAQRTGRFGGEMRQLKEIDHAIGRAAQSGIGGTDQPRVHAAPMLLAGKNKIVAHGELRNTCRSWKVRLTPRRLRSHGRIPVVALPSTRISPLFGASWPSTQLNSVDLPDQFGPIMPRISPLRTSNDTSLTAVMPPNDLRKLATSRTGLIARPLWRATSAPDGRDAPQV